jgi:hypothetical protein
MGTKTILSQIRRRPDIEEYAQIRRLWKDHSVAEESRDIPGLLATLTPDCRYEMPQVQRDWIGHDGAREFYETMLKAFPDIHFDLTNIVIGPQGVCEEASVTGTFKADWLTYKSTSTPVEFKVIIFFPWDENAQLFSGERIFVLGLDQLG